MSMSVTVTIEGLGSIVERLTALEAAVGAELVATVGSDVEYAGLVERGTRRMAARPYLAPAADQELPALLAALAQGAVETFETGDRGALARRFRAGVALVERAAQSIVAVRTGRLRASIHEDES